MNATYVCPTCRQSAAYENVAPGRDLSCPHCDGFFDVDAQGRPQSIPAAEVVAVGKLSTAALFASLFVLMDRLDTQGKKMLEGIIHVFDGLPQWVADVGRNLLLTGVKTARVLRTYCILFAVVFLPGALVVFGPQWFPRGLISVLFVLGWTVSLMFACVWGWRYATGRLPRLWRRSRTSSSKAPGVFRRGWWTVKAATRLGAADQRHSGITAGQH